MKRSFSSKKRRLNGKALESKRSLKARGYMTKKNRRRIDLEKRWMNFFKLNRQWN